jgi:uncharacterized membrane protein
VLYELLLFVHIAAAIVWLGTAFTIQVFAIRANRARDEVALKRLFDEVSALANLVFVPASLVVVLFGVLLVIESDAWSFGELWIVLGLIGYLATFVTGVGVLTPRVKRISEMVAQSGGTSPAAAAEIRRTLLVTRIDLVVLFLVVADMVLKPTGDDVGTLVVMALVLVAGVAYVLMRFRAIESPPAAAAPAGSP